MMDCKEARRDQTKDQTDVAGSSIAWPCTVLSLRYTVIDASRRCLFPSHTQTHLHTTTVLYQFDVAPSLNIEHRNQTQTQPVSGP